MSLRHLPAATAAARPIAAARIGAGAAAALQTLESGRELARLSDPALLRVPRFDWPPTLGEGLLPPFLAVWLALAAAFALGWRTRASGVLLAAVLGYVLLLDQQLYSNHLWLLTVLVVLLTAADAGARYSLDARRTGGADRVPAWPVLLVRVQVSLVYLFAVLAKLNLVWLSGLVLQTQVELPGIQRWPQPLLTALAAGALGTELFLGVALWRSRGRRLAVAAGLGFHLTLLVTLRVLPDLATFLLVMASAYLAFFSRFDDPSTGGELTRSGAGTASGARAARSRRRPDSE